MNGSGEAMGDGLRFPAQIEYDLCKNHDIFLI